MCCCSCVRERERVTAYIILFILPRIFSECVSNRLRVRKVCVVGKSVNFIYFFLHLFF
uniref:Uncharacterized protein n=1 Tax=Octopus bimaculoides TaxID=37653 RepID=A0A0L8GV42_OCTBM